MEQKVILLQLFSTRYTYLMKYCFIVYNMFLLVSHKILEQTLSMQGNTNKDCEKDQREMHSYILFIKEVLGGVQIPKISIFYERFSGRKVYILKCCRAMYLSMVQNLQNTQHW